MTPSFLRRLATLLISCTALLLTSCGGGGGVGQDGTGTTPDTLTTGEINGFGSVIVNGVHFDVSRADISLDGQSGRSQADLRVGMVVAVSGTVAGDGRTGQASRLIYESLLRGTIEAIPTTGSTLWVLGQRVNLTDATVFAGATDRNELQVGDRLQISGFREADGSLRATWVSREASLSELQLAGYLSAVGSSTVQVAGLTLTIGSAELVDIPSTGLRAGLFVRVVLQAAPVAGTANALRLRVIDTQTQDSLLKQQRQGLVAQWDAAASRFTLDGQVVQLNGLTRFDDGTRSDLANGLRVEVTGLLDAQRVLNATRVRLLPTLPTGYVRGRITALDLANDRLTVLSQPGVEVRLRTTTTLTDNLTVAGTALNLANLAVGDEVMALGLANGDRVDAINLTRLPASSLGRGVAGPARNIVGTSLTLLGVNVDASSATFFDASGAAMTSTAFFSTLASDDLIRAEGSFTLGGIQAIRVFRVR